MYEKFIYFDHGRKVYTVVSVDIFLMYGECRPYNNIELKFASEHSYKEVSKYEYTNR